MNTRWFPHIYFSDRLHMKFFRYRTRYEVIDGFSFIGLYTDHNHRIPDWMIFRLKEIEEQHLRIKEVNNRKLLDSQIQKYNLLRGLA